MPKTVKTEEMSAGRPADRIHDLASYLVKNKVIKNISMFEKMCGLSSYYIRNICATDKGNPGVDVIAKIYTTFPSVNLEWLVLGKGGMLKNKDENAAINALRQNTIEFLMANF